MTPLYRFSNAHLRDYARLLSAFIAAEKQKGLAVEVGVELDIKVAVSSLPYLKGSDQDQAAILVQVRSLLAVLIIVIEIGILRVALAVTKYSAS